LASGSADQSVKVWDLTRAACVLTLRHHDAEVQTVQWHPRDSAILSTASYDQRLRICDVRQHSNALTFSLESSPEATVWLSWSPTHLLLSDESGQVLAFDMRQPQKFLWRLGASSKPCSGLTVNHISGLLVTCSTEKDSPVKIWDIGSPDGQLGTTPSCLVSKTSDVGPAHCVSLCNDLESPFLLAVGGNHEQPHVFDLATLRSVRARWNLSGERIAHDTTNNTNINTNNKNNNMTNNNNKVEMITNVSNNNNNNNININNINNNNNNNKSKRANKKKKK
jgi:periodic tryptophan protein 1